MELANGLITNLLQCTEYATVFLDREFCVRMFTQPSGQLFNLRPADVGRLITEIAPNFNDPNLLEDCRAVLEKLTIIEREVWTQGNPLVPAVQLPLMDSPSARQESRRCYIRRALPFRTTDDHIDGVVVTLTDITNRKLAEQATQEARLYAEGIIETLREPLVVLDEDLRVRSANTSLYQSFNVTREETEGRLLYDLGNRQWNIPELQRLLEEVLPKNSHVTDYRVEHEFERIGHRTMLLNARRIRRLDGRPDQILLAFEDVTVRELNQRELRDRELRLQSIFDHALTFIGLLSPNGTLLQANRGSLRFAGIGEAEVIGQPLWLTPWWTHAPELQHRLRLAVQRAAAGEVDRFEATHSSSDGHLIEVEFSINPVKDDAGKVVLLVTECRDVTERKQAEEAVRKLNAQLEQRVVQRTAELQQSEERLRLFIEHAPAALAMFDRDMCYLAASRRWIADYNLDQVDLIGQSHYEVVPEISKHWRAVYQRGLAGEVIRQDEEHFQQPNGGDRWIRWEVRPWHAANGEVGGIVIFTEDISDRKKAEAALQEREERLRAILNTASDAIINIDRQGIITDANPATELMFGYTQPELVGQNVKILMPSPYQEEHDDYIARYLRTGQRRIIGSGRDVTARRKDGTNFPVNLAVSQVDHLGLFTGIVRNISERRKLEEDILRIADEEQRRIGQDLHDSTQQELAGLGLLASTLLDKLAKESGYRSDSEASDLSQLAQRILNGVTRAQREVQAISRGLVSLRLDPEGLMDALSELALRTDDLKGITCAFKCEKPVQVANSTTATHLYRIAQEAVANALKHGKPEHILISLESDDGNTVLQVADDGTGFDIHEQYEGLGLATMRYRASLIGANLSIVPIETGGTLISCKVFGGGSVHE